MRKNITIFLTVVTFSVILLAVCSIPCSAANQTKINKTMQITLSKMATKLVGSKYGTFNVEVEGEPGYYRTDITFQGKPMAIQTAKKLSMQSVQEVANVMVKNGEKFNYMTTIFCRVHCKAPDGVTGQARVYVYGRASYDYEHDAIKWEPDK